MRRFKNNSFGVPAITLCVIVGWSIAATTAHGVTWMRIFEPEEWDDCRCVQEIEDGYIVTGSKGDSLWLFETDSLGDVIWEKTYMGSDTSGDGNFVQLTKDGGYIITGIMYTGFSQILLLKTDKNGDTVWTQNFGRSIGHCVQQTQDGGYIITGRKNWIPSELFLLKTDSLGDSLWMRTYLPDGWTYSKGLFVEETDDGGYIVTGLIGYEEDDHFKEALWLIRTDSLGDTLWSYQGEGSWDYPRQGNSVRETRDGQYIALANFGLFKFNEEGDNLWIRDYRNGNCVQETEDGGYALNGDAATFLYSLNAAALLAEDISLLKTNEQGDSVWERTYIPGASRYLVQTRDKGFIMTGQSAGVPFLIKTDSLGILWETEEPGVETYKGWEVGSNISRRIVIFY